MPSTKKPAAKKPVAPTNPVVPTIDVSANKPVEVITPPAEAVEPKPIEVRAVATATVTSAQGKVIEPTDEEIISSALNKDTIKDVKADGKVIFILKDRELDGPIMAGGVTFTTRWNADRTHIIYLVDKDKADLFAKHAHVVHGKIIRAL